MGTYRNYIYILQRKKQKDNESQEVAMGTNQPFIKYIKNYTFSKLWYFKMNV